MAGTEAPSADKKPTCATCKRGATPDTTMNRCSNCKDAHYCSRECQRKGWKEHKKICGFTPTGKSTTFAKDAPIDYDRLEDWRYLDKLRGEPEIVLLPDRPQAEVYEILIDSFRLHVEDNYNVPEPHVHDDLPHDSLYDHEDPVKGFRLFLHDLEALSYVLPPWWNAEKRAECVAMGDKGNGWSNLHRAISSRDIDKHYKGRSVMTLMRMLAEEAEESNVKNSRWGNGGKNPWEKEVQGRTAVSTSSTADATSAPSSKDGAHH